MASVSFLRETFGRTYTSSITGDVTATRVFCVLFDGPIESMDEVIETAITGGLPELGDVYNSSPGFSQSLIAFSQTPIEIEKEKSYYNIQVDYRMDESIYASPTNRPWTISIRSIKEPHVPEQTLANAGAATGLPANVEPVGIGEPILNKAEFPFDPNIVDLKTKVEISLRRNFSDITDLAQFPRFRICWTG